MGGKLLNSGCQYMYTHLLICLSTLLYVLHALSVEVYYIAHSTELSLRGAGAVCLHARVGERGHNYTCMYVQIRHCTIHFYCQQTQAYIHTK